MQYINLTTRHPFPTTLKPTTAIQAIKGPFREKAMAVEFNALLLNGT